MQLILFLVFFTGTAFANGFSNAPEIISHSTIRASKDGVITLKKIVLDRPGYVLAFGEKSYKETDVAGMH